MIDMILSMLHVAFQISLCGHARWPWRTEQLHVG